jgi:hypothetical protein
MHKKIRKMTLSRETLRLLDGSALKKATGGQRAAEADSMDRTCQSLCFVCPETWPVVTG